MKSGVLVALDFSASLARDRFRHMIILLHWRRILGILMLFVATAVLVPISFTCAITASESRVTHEQMVRLFHASHRIGLLALAFQVVSAWLVLGKPFRPLRLVGAIVGFVVVSSIGGILLDASGRLWWRVAQVFM